MPNSYTAVDVINLARDLREDARLKKERPSDLLGDYIEPAAALLARAENEITKVGCPDCSIRNDGFYLFTCPKHK